MRDMVACFSEHAVRVSETTCSSHSNLLHLHQFLPQNTTTTTNSAVQTAVCLVYKITLSTTKQLLVTVTWSSTTIVGPQSLTIAFSDISHHNTTTFKLSTSSRLFRKKKGSRSINHEEDESASKIDLFWDFSEVNYQSGAEPINGYYIVIAIDSEIGLILGDESSSKKIKNGALMAKSCLLSRKEHYSGTALYSTKAQFIDNGVKHEITVKCSVGESEGMKQPVLTVYLDKKTVMRMKRLQWNFRGNHTIFIDGVLIDLFWDVHDWFFASGNGLAVFMFRRRIGIESRLWLEEKVASTNKQDQESSQFSLIIYASKI